jgi:hypothetical protein
MMKKDAMANELKPGARRENPRREYRFDYTRARPNRFAVPGGGGSKRTPTLPSPSA